MHRRRLCPSSLMCASDARDRRRQCVTAVAQALVTGEGMLCSTQTCCALHLGRFRVDTIRFYCHHQILHVSWCVRDCRRELRPKYHGTKSACHRRGNNRKIRHFYDTTVSTLFAKFGPPRVFAGPTLRFRRGYKRENIVMRPIKGPTPVLNCVPGTPRAPYATVSASPAGLIALRGLQEACRGRSGQGPHTGSGRPS